jgi:MSHA biogenesis protein MshN
MSLINKMLQDLDARGGDGARADTSSLVRPVNYGARGGLSQVVLGVGALAVALLGGGGYAAWKYFRSGKQAVPAPVVSHAPPAGAAQLPVQVNGPVAPAAADEGPPVVAGDISPEAHRAAGEKLARKMAERNAAARLAAADGADPGVPATERKAEKKERLANERTVARRRIAAHGRDEARPNPAEKVRVTGPAPAAVNEDREAGLSPQQKAENEYRRALAKLQDARVNDAIASLEQAVALYPRHEAARQTLVGLLLEGGRTAEATRQLALATSLDLRQANMAMLLARLQLENGGNALETLQRSLPYAESNADYRAMMAGVLQRANRNKEAVDHYQAAVRLQPANGVWWMGMGISLQADKRNAEARLAFQRAKDSGSLTPELQTFVERRLQQLD